MTMDQARLTEQARHDAQTLSCAGRASGRVLRRRGMQALLRLKRRRERLAAEADSASQWLLDNWYLAEREAREALQALRRMPDVRAAEGAALPEACCAGFLQACDNEISLIGLETYLSGFQSVLPLRSGELSALIPTMKLVIVMRLAALYENEDARSGASAAAGRLPGRRISAR